MNAAVPVQWDVPKSPQQEEVEERKRREKELELKEKEQQRIISIILENMVNISAGTFWMGETDADIQRFGKYSDVSRQQVKFAAFAISKYPVTQAQWQCLMGNNPSKFKGMDRPVERVSWDDAIRFCDYLSKKTNKSFRLPTQQEWECACRSGTETIWPFGDNSSLLKKLCVVQRKF